jgi:hypothetical protein
MGQIRNKSQMNEVIDLHDFYDFSNYKSGAKLR